MRYRLTRRKQAGQSLPIIAALIVVLFAMVGLAVDVGNTYAEQRATVRAADAAAIAAMNRMINGGTDADIAATIRGSFSSNKINIVDDGTSVAQAGQRDVKAYYLDNKGIPLLTCVIGRCGQVPNGTTYIQLKVSGQIDTFFARVVGQDQLPVKAQSFAQRCSPTNNVYPIAIRASDLDSKGFLPPSDPSEMQYYVGYKDSDYPTGKMQRRLYVKANNEAGDPPGSFTYLRWKAAQSAGSATELDRMLQGSGNLGNGFDEVAPWPDKTETAPVNYPLQPGSLSTGDWIHGNPGWSSSKAVRDDLQSFIDNRTKIILPIVSKAVGQGNNAAYKFDRFGMFYMRGFSDSGGKGAYFDLVYLGDASAVACMPTSVEDLDGGTPNPLAVKGAVHVKPRWTTRVDPQQPIEYTFVFDFSGSMSWNFAGWAGKDGAAVQCEVNVPGAVDKTGAKVPFRTDTTRSCNSWSPSSERRVVIARNAVIKFIDMMRENDTARIVGYANNNSTQFDNGNNTYNTLQPGATDANNYFFKGKKYMYTWAYPPENATSFTAAGFVPSASKGWLPGSPGWTTDKAVLKSWAKVAGSVSDPNSSSGGTPGGAGVKLAIDLLDKAPVNAPDGKQYKRVIIYLTDGVTNTWIDGKSPKPNGEAFNDYINLMCPGVTNADVIGNTAECQINKPSVAYPNGWSSISMPITQMTDQTDILKALYRSQDIDLQIFTLAIGTSPGTGLDKMASESSLAYKVSDPTAVESIFQRINIIAEGSCFADSGSWVSSIAPANEPDPNVFTDPKNRPDPANKVFGYVYLYDQFGKALTNVQNKLPITVDTQGNLTFALAANEGLVPGKYQMSAFVGYKGLDGVTRSYDSILNDHQTYGQKMVSFTVTESDGLGSKAGIVLPPVFLDLAADKKLCP